MRTLTNLTPLAALAFVLTACSPSNRAAETDNEAPAPMDSLVTAEWLAEHLNDPDLVVLDATVLIEQDEDGGFRTVNGRPNYEAGHIPTAGFADLMGDLSDGDSPYAYTVPSPEDFAAAMGALGVGDDTRVVIYDAYTSSWAARVWWMLRWAGFDNAALLDGGLQAWTDAGYELSTEPSNEPVRTLTPNVRPELIVDRDEVLAAIDQADIEIIDALPEAQYRGETQMYARPGHITSASNVPVFSLLDENGRYKSAEDLAASFSTPTDQRTITYCGGGIAASSLAFAMTRLGYEDVAVYTSSLQEWAADPSNPMVTGAEPGSLND